MPGETSVRGDESRETQLHTIRDLMLAASRRGAWLTLGEIAGLTEIGEASISAQLRHLRKRRHGHHVVEKRRRASLAVMTAAADERRGARGVRTIVEAAKWEYRVLRQLDEEPKETARRHDGVEQNCDGGSHAEAGA